MRAWDCGTGSGQAAAGLAHHFDEVVASDVSERQIAHAPRTERVRYLVCRSEASPFPDGRIDLITVAQALHWFDFEPFFTEVQRVARTQGVLGFWSYGLLKIAPGVDAVLGRLYGDVLGEYWLPERKHVEEAYANIPVPFERLEVMQLEMRMEWSLEDLLGYLYTWSAGRIYVQRHGEDPISLVEAELRAAWGDAERLMVVWPVTLRAFRVT